MTAPGGSAAKVEESRVGETDPDPAGEPESPGWSADGPGSPGWGDRSAGPSDSVRQEAERLVATALGAIRLAVTAAGSPTGGAGHVTGAAECAFCPICRTIAALREPDPDFAERLATAAGDLAIGVTGLLRAFSTVAGARAPDGTAVAEPDADRDTADGVWREATRTRHDSGPAPARAPQPSAPPGPAGTTAEGTPEVAHRRVPTSRGERVSAPRGERVPGADDGPARRD